MKTTYTEEEKKEILKGLKLIQDNPGKYPSWVVLDYVKEAEKYGIFKNNNYGIIGG